MNAYQMSYFRTKSFLLLQVENIHKYYGKLHVLKGISFKMAKSEILSVSGPSGAGKSTLLQILGTLDKPDEGRFSVDGAEPLLYKPKKIAKFRNSQIGFIFQFHHLLPEFTALENICIPAFIQASRSTSEIREKALELLSIFKLENRTEHKPSQLSGGEQERVAVARALINDPKLILADEPSGNLDTQNADELHQLFFDLRDKFGQTFIIVTHNKDLAAMAERQIRLKDGQIDSIR